MFFTDRTDAGARLAACVVAQRAAPEGYHVVGRARGGVPIGFALAQALGLPLSALLIDDMEMEEEGKHLFVTPFGSGQLYQHTCEPLYAEDVSLLPVTGYEQLLASVRERQLRYNGETFEPGSHVILCDDGVVSGKTAFTAATLLRQHFGVESIIFATPVVPSGFRTTNVDADQIIYWRRSTLPAPTTGMFYKSFDDVPDDTVTELVNARRLVPA